MESAVLENEVIEGEVCEVRISAMITPDEIDSLLDMAGTTGLLGSDELIAAEDMAWGCAYQGEEAACRFIQARINTPDGEKPIGFLCFAELPNWERNFELFCIVVAPDYQRLGIGSALIAEMERIAMEWGGKRIFLETGEGRQFEKSRLFYEANGFAVESHFYKQFIPKDDGVIYCRTLEPAEDSQSYQ
ncbi:GNAT family N-acetyltransferase [Pseudodesulfovibrio sediminis]|nr:GNAT family N-acetyltransferase [Pseudodesulfovibrio sediminis]